MAIDDRLSQILKAEREIRFMHAEIKGVGTDSGSGGSGPTDDRVTRLEGRIDKVADELGDVKVNIATLTERVSHLPSKGFIVTTTTAALALVAAIAVFADNIKAAFG
ncbi:hypothetical protein IP68_02295 [Blastomonas sp. AAP25]|uniref:hypothetical protein n=1 Tax=Blastomonas sp. AAP25 TaxID=1523416 RepID=UPI0006B8DB8D|nr:hypothetical protein [Blastomonas sp. AAP25]KPF76745.1 hypothetical protein IP68_02295 [Blastomonas sp. AAP25]